MGDIRCGTLPHFRSQGIVHQNGQISKEWPKLEGYDNVNVCSNSKRYKGLSPMVLGPFGITETKFPTTYYPSGLHPGFTDVGNNLQGIQAANVEAYWQSSKIYNIDVVNGQVQQSFFERRAKFMVDPKPHRRTVPKKQGHPVAAYFDGKVMGYVPSRIYYITTYEYLASRTPEYQDLVRRFNSGERLHILGFDGRDPASGLAYGANPITYEALERAMYDPTKPFGHELVLCGMLLGLRPWQNFDMQRAKQIAGF